MVFPARLQPHRPTRVGMIPLVSTAVLVVLGLGGCPFVQDPASTPGVDPKDNNTFATASDVGLDADVAEFTAEIDSADDVDVFDLGTLAPGDRLVVDVQTVSGNLDAIAAVFDEREYLHAFNDDRTADSSNLDPLIDVVIRGPEGDYFLGVAPFPDGASTGSYSVTVRISRDLTVPHPEPQVVYLDWAGGEHVVIKNVGTYNVDPFDAADVGLAGQTAELKDAIEAEVADRFDGFALDIRNSDNDPVPATPHSTVYFGGLDRSAFAIAEQIDTFNSDQGDSAIIFTDGFRNAFAVTPTLEQMATAIGNTAAHEIGHLLGLVHTEDCSGLMDTTCGNDSILFRQVFKLSPIDDSVFPIGYQNARELIEWAIGLAGI